MPRAELLQRNIANFPVSNQSDFRLEYKESVSDQALINDIVSYLGEYRFRLPKFSYSLKYSNNKLRDPHEGGTMQELTQRSIDKKVLEGSTSSREIAEKQGIMSLDRQLMAAKDNDTVIWASPPGAKEDGYGNYGFIFMGNVRVNHLFEKTVQMTAIRIENPKIEQFNQAMSLLTGEKTDHQTAEEFLADSRVVSGHLEEGYVDAILGRSFSFKANQEEQEKFALIMRQMSPLISDFIRSAKDPFKTRGEKIKELYALENYALKLKTDYDRLESRRENFITNFNAHPGLQDLVKEGYDREPPKVAGSCPGSRNRNIFSKGSVLNGLLEGDMDYEFDQDGPCKKCNAMNVKCGPCGICKACDLAIRASEKNNLN